MATIDSIYSQLLSTQSLNQYSTTSGASAPADLSSDFSDIIGKALADSETTEAAATEENMALLSGDNTNIHNVVLAAEKAEVALRLTLQIRNKVLDAYNEIMRMQV